MVDGAGTAPRHADIAIVGDAITAVGEVIGGRLHTIGSEEITFTDGSPTDARRGTVLRSGR